MAATAATVNVTILPGEMCSPAAVWQEAGVGNVFKDRLADIWVCAMESYRDYTRFKKCSKCELLDFLQRLSGCSGRQQWP